MHLLNMTYVRTAFFAFACIFLVACDGNGSNSSSKPDPKPTVKTTVQFYSEGGFLLRAAGDQNWNYHHVYRPQSSPSSKMVVEVRPVDDSIRVNAPQFKRLHISKNRTVTVLADDEKVYLNAIDGLQPLEVLGE